MAKPIKKERKYASDNFLEAFRDLGLNVAEGFKEDVLRKTGEGIGESLSNQFLYGNRINTGEQKNRSEKSPLPEKISPRPIETFKTQEKVLYSRQDNELKLQVHALQKEIQDLARASGELSKEAEIASLNTSEEVGTYHLSFFQQLRNLIRDLRQKIQESSIWLAEWNKKSQKKNYYWGQAKKHGSSFMLNSDRQVATQTG